MWGDISLICLSLVVSDVEHLFTYLSSIHMFFDTCLFRSFAYFLKVYLFICYWVVCVVLSQLQSCLSLCNPMDCSLPGLSVHVILQARILQWVARIPPGDRPDPEFEPAPLRSPALAGRFFTTSTTWEAHWVIWVPCIFEH